MFSKKILILSPLGYYGRPQGTKVIGHACNGNPNLLLDLHPANVLTKLTIKG